MPDPASEAFEMQHRSRPGSQPILPSCAQSERSGPPALATRHCSIGSWTGSDTAGSEPAPSSQIGLVSDLARMHGEVASIVSIARPMGRDLTVGAVRFVHCESGWGQGPTNRYPTGTTRLLPLYPHPTDPVGGSLWFVDEWRRVPATEQVAQGLSAVACSSGHAVPPIGV
jgi:hypothetical protein